MFLVEYTQPKIRNRAKMSYKPILCLDFDGVIHSYAASGWQGATVISDPPVPGAFDFIMAASEYFTIAIYSSRSGQDGGIRAMQDYMTRHWPDHLAAPPEISWPTRKPSAFLTIDDRGYTFDGTWPDPASLLAFKPWNKR
jgi:hypothetical protein